MRIWVDTDFGFDDLWALLLLRHLNVQIDGVSLVAGNVPLPQVFNNAVASTRTFDLKWQVFIGAAKPLQRSVETAESILGKSGMLSRGLQLPDCSTDQSEPIRLLPGSQNAAIEALASWLSIPNQQHVLALGPLTNIALLLKHYPVAAKNIAKLTWMGGSGGRGNHSEFAEYNAIADPEALAAVTRSDIPFRMIDLELCRQVTFTENDMPAMQGRNSQLLSDLLGGYLDIALNRGRSSMAIYDPVAALSIAAGEIFNFVPASVYVHTSANEHYGQTVLTPHNPEASIESYKFEYATTIDASEARKLCLDAFDNA